MESYNVPTILDQLRKTDKYKNLSNYYIKKQIKKEYNINKVRKATLFDVLTASKQSELDMDVETLIPKMTRLSVDYWHNQYNQEQLPLLTNKKVKDWKVE